MSDEALNAHLDWLDKANDQGEDYETWLEKRVTKLEEEKAVLLDYNKLLVDQNVELRRATIALENEYATLRQENAALSELLSPLVDVELERDTLKSALDVAMSENQRLTKHVEDYEEENANLVERSNRAMTRAIQAEAKLTAIECAGCGKTMLECACDEVE